MAKRKRWKLSDDLPVVGELQDCRQLSDDHWRGTTEDGTIFDVHGGKMPEEYVLVALGCLVPICNSWGYTGHGIVRLVPARAAC